jgi:hypothetical protein
VFTVKSMQPVHHAGTCSAACTLQVFRAGYQQVSSSHSIMFTDMFSSLQVQGRILRPYIYDVGSGVPGV